MAHQQKLRAVEDAVSTNLPRALSICEEFELEHGGMEDLGTMLPFYRIQLILYLFDDILSAHWLWQRMPPVVKEDSELQSIWNIARFLWNRNFPSAFSSLLSVPWTNPSIALLAQSLVGELRARNAALIARSHTSVAIDECANLLGLTEAEAAAHCKALGWETHSQDPRLLIPTAPPPPPPPRGSGLVSGGPAEKLQELTELVCRLDAR